MSLPKNPLANTAMMNTLMNRLTTSAPADSIEKYRSASFFREFGFPVRSLHNHCTPSQLLHLRAAPRSLLRVAYGETVRC